MLYTLVTGRTISISVEQFLSMTDEEEQYLVSLNYGDVIHSPFFRSAINDNKQKLDNEDDTEIDFVEESDELLPSQQPLNIEEELLDDPGIEGLEAE